MPLPDEGGPHVHDLAEPEEDPGGLVQGPTRLSETGLYADIARRQLAPGVEAYAPRYPLWSDGSDKQRFLLLPPGTRIDTSTMDGWSFPVGTRAWKHFFAGGRLVETRLLWKVRGDVGHRGWWKVAYVWNEEGTEAFAHPEGARDALGTSHDVPSQKDCDRCHRGGSDVLLGVEAIQLSDGGAGFLDTLARSGRLTDPPSRTYQVPGAGVVQAALGYLHANCGICHNERYHLVQARALLMEVRTEDVAPEATGVYRTTFGAPLRHVLPDGQTAVVVPGEPARSGLVGRMRKRDGGLWQMPPLASERVDEEALRVIEAWIASLPRG